MYFHIDELKVWGSLDYCRSIDGEIFIYDQETRRSNSKATAKQLACYALYAQETLGVDFGQLHHIEFNLAKNEVINYPTREVDMLKIQSEIQDSASTMLSLLIDIPGNIPREKDFDPTLDPEICCFCSFRGCCPENQALLQD